LREALAREWGVDPDAILLGNGASELIHFLARTGRFSEVELIAPVFSEFQRAFGVGQADGLRRPAGPPNAPDVSGNPHRRAGGPPQAGSLPYLTVVTRPANPTGEMPLINLDTPGALLIDESFVEFTGEPSLARHVNTRPNLYVLRSLTKFYALPGLRIGALVAAPAVIHDLRKLREPWQVNVLAERAALAALSDHAHYARTLDFIQAERCRLGKGLAELPGVHPQPSRANYLLTALDYPAAPLLAHLLERKILLRDCTGWPGVPFASSVRIAVRTPQETERLLTAWKEFPCAS
jgi:threonine-phosphate decarboxylase